jgi:hypothetical protein
MRENMDFEESLEGEEEEAVVFPLSFTGWGIPIFNILLACED